MDWVPLISTGIGAAIALGGTVLADVVRSRDTRERDRLADRKEVYLQLTLAHGLALQGLRDVTRGGYESDEHRRSAAAAALTAADIYPARERLLMAAPRWVLRSAEAAFDQLIEVRDAVRDGAGTTSAAYHDAYHPYAERMWALRNSIRSDLGSSQLRPSDLARESWENRESCRICQGRIRPQPAEPMDSLGSAAASGNP
jgi:hypothetical protein